MTRLLILLHLPNNSTCTARRCDLIYPPSSSFVDLNYSKNSGKCSPLKIWPTRKKRKKKTRRRLLAGWRLHSKILYFQLFPLSICVKEIVIEVVIVKKNVDLWVFTFFSFIHKNFSATSSTRKAGFRIKLQYSDLNDVYNRYFMFLYSAKRVKNNFPSAVEP